MRDPEKLFLITGLLRKACMAGGWIPLVVRLGTELEFSGVQLLLLGTAMEVAVLLFEIPTGLVADTVSLKWSVVLGALLLGGAQLASGIGTAFIFFVCTQFIWGIGWTFISGAEVAWITGQIGSPEAVEPLILRRARLQFAATIVGILGFGSLGHIVSLQAAVIVAGVVGVTWALALAVLMPETEQARRTTDRRREFVRTLRVGARLTARTPALLVLGAVLVTAGMAAEALDRLDIRRLADLGLDDAISPIGIFAAIALGQAALGGAALWRWESRLTGSRVAQGMAVLFVLNGLAAIAIGNVNVLAAVALLYVVQGALLDVSDPLVVMWTNAFATDDVRATVHSFAGQLRALGEVSSGIVLGAVAAGSNVPTTLTVAGVIFLVAGTIAAQARSWWEPVRTEADSRGV